MTSQRQSPHNRGIANGVRRNALNAGFYAPARPTVALHRLSTQRVGPPAVLGSP